MTVINTNTAATLTANALTKNERAMNQTMERLSTGQRINSAADDAAGLAISSKMTSQINGLNMAVKNANDAISMLQTYDGALIEISSMSQRMRELAVQSASDTNTTADRTALNTEFEQLTAEIERIAANTQWNGTNL
jgi:flagellin